MLLIAGLGNPGRRYAGNRHNIGFMAAEEIHRRHHFSPWRARFHGEVSEGRIGGEKALLLKPATFMNESGRAVGEAMRFYKLAAADVVVLYDELDLPSGKVRIKAGGGRPSHKGLQSISAHIGNDYRRVRIGIGHPGHRSLVNAYVLKDFARAELESVRAVTGAIADHVPELAKGNDSSFMNKVHLTLVDSGLFDGEDNAPEPQKTGANRSAGRSKVELQQPGRSALPRSNAPSGGALADGLRKLFRRKQ